MVTIPDHGLEGVEGCRWVEGGRQCNEDVDRVIGLDKNDVENSPITPVAVCYKHFRLAKKAKALTIAWVDQLT